MKMVNNYRMPAKFKEKICSEVYKFCIVKESVCFCEFN